MKPFLHLPLVPLLLAALAPTTRAQTSAPDVVVFTGAVDVDLDGAELGGIHVMRRDGTGVRKITSFQTLGLNWEEHGFNLPDDHPDVSPDGRRIVFTSNRHDRLDWDLHIMDVNGTAVERLAPAPGLDIEPVFSPDGRRLAFASERFGTLDICTLDLTTGQVVRLTSSPQEDIEPAWSPDGQWIAFARVQGNDEKDVFLMRADGSGLRQITFHAGEDHDPKFSPDGLRLAITSERAFSPPYGDVWTIDAFTGANATNLTSDLSFGAGDPSWSPDGTHLAFFHSSLPILTAPQRLFVMRADGSQKRMMPPVGLLNIHPNWGPIADTDGDGRADYLENGNTHTTGRDFGRDDTNALFGTSVALADLTRDGFPEVAIGAPGEVVLGRSAAGVVNLARGSEQGLDFRLFGLSGPGLPQRRVDARFFGEPLTAGGRFGATLVSGDFDDDGFRDFAIGAPGQNIVCLLYGASGPTQVLRGPAGSDFGAALAVGDFDRNGVDDLAVGAPRAVRAQVAAGSVSVFRGLLGTGLSPNPLILDQSLLPDLLTSGGPEVGDEFGAALAAGDLNGDGAAELAIGAPGERIGRAAQAGLVHVVPGSPTATLQLAATQLLDGRSLPAPHGGTQAGARFGDRLVTGDFNADLLRLHDLVVGVPRLAVQTIPEAGLVAVFPARVGSPLVDPPRIFTAPDLGGVLAGFARFGETLASADLSGDGPHDLAIAAPGETVGTQARAGRVYVVSGNRASGQSCAFCAPGTFLDLSSGGLYAAGAQVLTSTAVGVTPAAGHRFGSALGNAPNALAAADLDGDGQAELFLGMPEASASGNLRAGRVGIRFGVAVGTFALSPHAGTFVVGETQVLELRWTHPRAWRAMDAIHLRLVNDDGAFLWLRFEEASQTLRQLDPRSGRFGRARAVGQAGRLANPWVGVDVGGASVLGSGPTGRDVTLHLPLRFGPRAAGLSFRVEVFASDDRGNAQGFQGAGTLDVIARG